MNERPILFSAPMVLAILDGRKTQTRRIVQRSTDKPCPYGDPGDRLWVRETFRVWQDEETLLECRLAGITDGERKELIRKRTEYRASSGDAESGGWRPSIFMPRWASRLTLEITGVRIERLSRISEDDAQDEGAGIMMPQMEHYDGNPDKYRLCFRALWELINGTGSWERDPLVWVVNFRRI